MKKIKLLLIAFISLIAFQSCEKDDSTQSAQLTDDEINTVVESDVATDDLLDLVDTYAFESTSERSVSDIPSCVTQTITLSGNLMTITWQFDANGCTMPNGNTYKGTVIITREKDLTTRAISGNITFDNFYVNDIQIEGSADFIREINADGNPQTIHNYDFTITLPNGDTTERAGTRTRVWAEGYGTVSRTDDVFLITGSSHIKQFDGDILDMEIIQALRREIPCRFFVSGTIKIIKNGSEALLDYGDGTCDAEATLTLPDGTIKIIHL